MGGRGVGIATLCLIVAVGVAASPADAATISNPTPITDPNQSGPDQPYPSEISVAGEAGTVVKVRATLNDVSGGPERDLDVLLRGPGGSTILISDICSAGGFVPDFTGITLTFDDDAAAALPETCMSGTPSGTYRPTNYDTADNFPGIAPPYPLGLANLRGTSPNGAWQLFVVDDTNPDPVTIDGGWTLELTTTGAPVATTPVVLKKKKCKKRKRKSATEAKKKRCTKRRR